MGAMAVRLCTYLVLSYYQCLNRWKHFIQIRYRKFTLKVVQQFLPHWHVPKRGLYKVMARHNLCYKTSSHISLQFDKADLYEMLSGQFQFSSILIHTSESG
jgi:hypothetical protein